MAQADSIDSLQQTLVIPVKGEAKVGGPAPKPVALLQGTGPDFSAETNRILQDRLRQASLFLFLGYLAFLIKAILIPSHAKTGAESLHLGMFTAVTAIMGIVAYRLCSKCHHFLSHLRGVEWLVFGSSALLFVVKGYTHLLYTASQGYLAQLTPPWIILIFTYALFIPNTWKRALTMITPMALGPLLIYVLAWQTSPNVAMLIEDTSDFHHVFLDAFMAMSFVTFIAVGGVRLIRGLRTQAFEAEQLGQYRLKQLLGRGGMGEVYLAEHVMLKRPCAIKIIRPEKAGDPGTLARFEQEVQSTAKLTHWNTVEIFDFGRTEDGTFYYVMEYLPGMSLEQIVEMHGPLPPGRIIHLLTQTCEALAEAHEHGMVHRDIKPANIFAAKRGGTYDVAKLLDFGLVRSLDHDDDMRLTQDGTVTGSPLYMSPEQARGDAVDVRSDIYALGCVAYHLLTGRPPFMKSRPVKLILAHASQIADRPSSLRADVPADLEGVILRCLEKSADDRFDTVVALRDALLDCRDAGTWDREAAAEWWEHHGCQKKKTIDACISAGIPLPEHLPSSVHVPGRAMSTI
ncbi:serine/threonine protein kinase [Planctomicrobium sp. SH661]|uniref:serine/threonine protein kinase n=1 Tax=Planctomicrobium sp. SH661 TaxID=3448124 RepID=UPI003F5AED25